jgi:hypothetical protein
LRTLGVLFDSRDERTQPDPQHANLIKTAGPLTRRPQTSSDESGQTRQMTSNTGEGCMNRFIDEGIAHIARVMRPALHGEEVGLYLSSDYWRKRLYQILDTAHLNNAQLRAVDSLLLELDEFDRRARVPAVSQAYVEMAG